MRCIRFSASSLMKLPCMTCDRDGAMGLSRSSLWKTSSRGIDGASALYVGRELPALVAGRAHDAIELFGIDEKRAARVGIGLPVKLAAKRSVWHALVGGADALPAIQGNLCPLHGLKPPSAFRNLFGLPAELPRQHVFNFRQLGSEMCRAKVPSRAISRSWNGLPLGKIIPEIKRSRLRRVESRLLSFLLRLQILQQPLESFLIGVVAFPVAEIPNMPLAPDRCRPCLRGIHHGLIQSNGEEHGAVFALLTFETGFDFLPDPCAADGVLRKHDE
ncbi:MAG: hypothetical protein JWP63_1910 [Candidatus Solibacter sp.]|nr:hypothetical protein [Candidatus Solibacter sp.]